MPQNVRKYLMYAMGEILLVMIGILLALQVNNWNENRLKREKEQVYLKLLQQNLRTDLEVLKMNQDFYAQVLNQGTKLLEYNRTRELQGETQWDLLVASFHASQIWPVILESSTFEELKSTGDLSIIKNSALRERMVFYYGGGISRYSQTIGINPPYRKISRMMIPYHVQGYMWNACHETVGDIQILKDCEANISENETKEILIKMLESEELLGELNFFMAAIRAGIKPLLEQRKLSEFILQEIEKSINRK
jgi:hypothetical protein